MARVLEFIFLIGAFYLKGKGLTATRDKVSGDISQSGSSRHTLPSVPTETLPRPRAGSPQRRRAGCRTGVPKASQGQDCSGSPRMLATYNGWQTVVWVRSKPPVRSLRPGRSRHSDWYGKRESDSHAEYQKTVGNQYDECRRSDPAGDGRILRPERERMPTHLTAIERLAEC